MDPTEAKVAALSCWRGPVTARRLPGGITNVNYVVEHAHDMFVVRLGGDIPVHHVMRFNELAANRRNKLDLDIVSPESLNSVTRIFEAKSMARRLLPVIKQRPRIADHYERIWERPDRRQVEFPLRWTGRVQSALAKDGAAGGGRGGRPSKLRT